MAVTTTSGGLRTGIVARYAIGSVGTGGFATLPGLVLVFYLTDTLGVAAWAAGIVVTVVKIWDVVIDPVIGGISDTSLHRTGSRRRLMAAGSLALPVFFLLTFAVPAGVAPTAAAMWVGLAFLLASTAFSLFQVPYIALPAELSAQYDQRTRLLTSRVSVLSLGILLFGAGGPMLRNIGDAYTGYLVMALVAGVVIALGLLTAASVAPRGAPNHAAPPSSWTAGYRDGVAALRRSAPFRALLTTFGLQAVATGIMLAGANYVAVWVMHSDDALTFLFVALIAPAIVCSPVWNTIARRVGKERGFGVLHFLMVMISRRFRGRALEPGELVFDLLGMDVTNPFRGLVALGGPKHLKDGGFWARAEAVLHFGWAIALLGFLLGTLALPLLA